MAGNLAQVIAFGFIDGVIILKTAAAAVVDIIHLADFEFTTAFDLIPGVKIGV